MKKAMALCSCAVLAAALSFSGCSKTKKAMSGMARDICGDKAVQTMMSDAWIEFNVRIMLAGPMGDLVRAMDDKKMSDDDIIKKMKQDMSRDMARDADKKIKFSSCATQAETMKCDAAFKEIAGDKSNRMQEALGKDAVKNLTDIAGKMNIKNCGVITVKARADKKDKEETHKVYVGEINGKVTSFFVSGMGGM